MSVVLVLKMLNITTKKSELTEHSSHTRHLALILSSLMGRTRHPFLCSQLFPK